MSFTNTPLTFWWVANHRKSKKQQLTCPELIITFLRTFMTLGGFKSETHSTVLWFPFIFSCSLADVLSGEDHVARLTSEAADVPLLLQRQERLTLLDLCSTSRTVWTKRARTKQRRRWGEWGIGKTKKKIRYRGKKRTEAQSAKGIPSKCNFISFETKHTLIRWNVSPFRSNSDCLSLKVLSWPISLWCADMARNHKC